VASVRVDHESLGLLHDDGLLFASEQISVHRRHLDLYAAAVAGELARRSRRELGFSGLAQRKGFTSTEALVHALSQVSHAEATKLVRVGSLMSEVAVAEADSAGDSPGDSPDIASPWPASLVASITAATLTTDAADAIRRGLGETDSAITGAMLAAAIDVLLVEARGLSVDQLFRRAREVRNGMDEEGIARREKQQRDDRCMKRWIRSDGMYALSGVLDPESGRVIFAALDDVMSPRRGGPRFVDSTEIFTADSNRADAILADPRTDEQVMADALVAMVQIAVDADRGTLFGGRRPAVRVLVSEETMRAESGHGHIEGTTDAVAFETVSRYICENGIVGVAFDDDGQCVNVGRDSRLFETADAASPAAIGRLPGARRTTSCSGIAIGAAPTSPTAQTANRTLRRLDSQLPVALQNVRPLGIRELEDTARWIILMWLHAFTPKVGEHVPADRLSDVLDEPFSGRRRDPGPPLEGCHIVILCTERRQDQER